MQKISIILLVVLTISCQSSEYADHFPCTSAELRKTILDEENGFSISLPTHFSIAEPNSYFELIAIDSSSVQDGLITSLSVETYELKDNQSFEDFYKDIAERTQKAATTDTLNYDFHFTDQFTVQGRESKVSTVTFSANGLTLSTRTFYIKDESTILTVTVATTSKQADEEICKLMPSVNSVRKI